MGRAFEFRKARKMKRWSAMAKTFTRIGKDIVMAVKEGGPDPDNNSRLRAVIQNAKAANMPKENVERAIKKASDKDSGDFKEVLFEGYAPHGIAVLVETATDNNNRTVANIRSYFNKANGNLGTAGSVEFMFDHSCNFRINATGLDPEEIELEFIDFGVEEVFVDDDGMLLYAPFESFGEVQKELEKRAFEILSSGFERIPQSTKSLDLEAQEEVLQLIEHRIPDGIDISRSSGFHGVSPHVKPNIMRSPRITRNPLITHALSNGCDPLGICFDVSRLEIIPSC